MSDAMLDLAQPIGAPLPNWRARPRPPRTAMHGRFCRVEPLEPARHADDLFAANQLDGGGRNFTYLFQEPFQTLEAYRAWLGQVAPADDPLFHAIVDATTGKAVGLATFMRIDPAHGVIEVGNINYSPLLQRTAAATEAMFLMMRRVFEELGYRRYEWKCDSLNAPSRAAALRLGFQYEGLFRQAVVYKQRNRDTAWFSIIDADWPCLKQAYVHWLAPTNFDAQGRQIRALGTFIEAARAP
jgi:RimJ/RimL family protein N-acetyltransferase